MSRPHTLDYHAAAQRWFGRGPEQLDDTTRKALAGAASGQALTQDPVASIDSQTSLGGRMADRVAAFGGSWTFIALFAAGLLGWMAINSGLLGRGAFDPYPYIFLNLMLSTIAALQAPVIMMSQNRQAQKDRRMAAHDYAVNLKAEIEIMALHEKMDALRSEQLMTVITQQQAQLDMLTRLLGQGTQAR